MSFGYIKVEEKEETMLPANTLFKHDFYQNLKSILHKDINKEINRNRSQAWERSHHIEKTKCVLKAEMHARLRHGANAVFNAVSSILVPTQTHTLIYMHIYILNFNAVKMFG